jgi:hypothetical protein
MHTDISQVTVSMNPFHLAEKYPDTYLLNEWTKRRKGYLKEQVEIDN